MSVVCQIGKWSYVNTGSLQQITCTTNYMVIHVTGTKSQNVTGPHYLNDDFSDLLGELLLGQFA